MIFTDRRAKLAQEVILDKPDTAKNAEEKSFKRGIKKDHAEAKRKGWVLDIPAE